MDPSDRLRIIDNYRQLLHQHGAGPAVGQWSAEGQRFRFQKLVQIADLSGARILNVGCGIGDLYPFLNSLYQGIDYTGVDIVPELVDYAAHKYPAAKFLCADLLAAPINGVFDYALISGVFNNRVRDATAVLQELLGAAFARCERGLAFNFISNRVDEIDPKMAYHDPVEVFRYCLADLSNKVVIAHHYERRDVAVYVYR